MDMKKRGRKPGTPNTTAHNELIRQSRSGKIIINDGIRGKMVPYEEARELILAPESFWKMGSLKSRQTGMTRSKKI